MEMYQVYRQTMGNKPLLFGGGSPDTSGSEDLSGVQLSLIHIYSIPYERMWPDGICRISDSHYTKIIQFQDINYQLSQNEDKTAIFEGWCDFLNYFDSSIHFQLSFLRSEEHTSELQSQR